MEIVHRNRLRMQVISAFVALNIGLVGVNVESAIGVTAETEENVPAVETVEKIDVNLDVNLDYILRTPIYPEECPFDMDAFLAEEEARKKEANKQRALEIEAIERAKAEEFEAQRIKLSDITWESDNIDRILAIFDFFVRQEGFTPEGAAGIIGNISVESGFEPATVSGSGYTGLCQWNTNASGGYWWYDISYWLEENGYAWDSFEGQVKAILYCPRRGSLDSVLEELKSTTDIGYATELFASYYEACASSTVGTRISDAYWVYDVYCSK